MAEAKQIQKFRIHGDNILECERALILIFQALDVKNGDIKFFGEASYAPLYRIEKNGVAYEIKLFPGYDRWGINLKQYLIDAGGTLREATDAIITRLLEKDSKFYERPVVSIEFCGALPAGNNAWQRCGRALASAYAKIPYLYFVEIGGVELDANRKIKAFRFPNPLVPFSYLTLGEVEQTVAIPVFIPSPSLGDAVKQKFEQCFGFDEAIKLIREILLDNDCTNEIKKLKERATKVVRTLANERKRKDCLPEADWDIFSQKQTGKDKAQWLAGKAMAWHKKIGLKTVTKTFLTLLRITKKFGVAAGSSDMPFCLIPANKRKEFCKNIAKIYRKRVNQSFLQWTAKVDKPLVCVWIAGFKPRGDDSRPDRGLVPLARMIFGRTDIDLLTVVYGPAKSVTWRIFTKDLRKLAIVNGLWEAILGLSDAVLVDTPTNKKMCDIGRILIRGTKSKAAGPISAANPKPSFGEHDVDSVIHLLFSDAFSHGVYEGLCNPPGGDWSGIRMVDFDTMDEYKWTSLPRVSAKDTKRPDHLIQFKEQNILLSIESKDTVLTLEDAIGTRLKRYINILIKHSPIAIKKLSDFIWRPSIKKVTLKGNVISGAAFRVGNHKEMSNALKRGKVDVVFGMEFLNGSYKVRINILFNKNYAFLASIIEKLGNRYKELWEINIAVSS